MAIDLVARGLEQRLRVLGVRGNDVDGTHRPDADTLLAARIEIARMLDCHAGVGRVQTADVLVIETAARADEDLEEQRCGLVADRGIHRATPLTSNVTPRGSRRAASA